MKTNMNEVMKGIIIFIFAGLLLSFAACNKDNDTTETSALIKTALLTILCRMAPQRLVG